MLDNPLISVVILNYNGEELLRKCLRSVLANAYPDFEVLVVDNGSTDGSEEKIRNLCSQDSRIRFIRLPQNAHFTGGMNKGMQEARGELVVLLGNDTELDRDFLKEVRAGMSREDVWAATPKIYITGTDKILDNTGGLLDRLGYGGARGRLKKDSGQYDAPDHRIFYASGSAPIYRRRALEKVGYFDPLFLAHSEDVDLSWRIRLAGGCIAYLPKAVVHHAICQTIGRTETKASLLFNIRKNRLALLIKNYALGNLFLALPAAVLVNLALFLKELIVERRPRNAVTALQAVWWNSTHLPYLAKQRTFVQRTLRRCPDRRIIAAMARGFGMDQ